MSAGRTPVVHQGTHLTTPTMPQVPGTPDAPEPPSRTELREFLRHQWDDDSDDSMGRAPAAHHQRRGLFDWLRTR